MKPNLKRLVQITIALCVILAIPARLKAQGLGLKSVILIQDTLSFGDTIRGSAILFNYDTASAGFTGDVQYILTINGSPASILSPDTQILHIPASSGVQYNFTIPVVQPQFIVGPDVVIIWPYSPGKPTDDTLKFTVHILEHPLALKEQQANTFSAFLAENSLKLDLGDYKKDIQRVRIYALSGAIIYEENNSIPLEIPLQKEGAGIYFCEVLWKDNQRKVVKFFKE